MYASVQKQGVPFSAIIRNFGRAGALIIAVSWLSLVIAEFFRNRPPVIETYYQAAMLAIVFVGYAVGWRYEAVGGALAILGTIGFVVLNVVMFGYLLIAGTLGFAVPGVFYLIAHYVDHGHVAERGWRP